MQKLKSKVTVYFPNGIRVKCDPDQVNEVIKNYKDSVSIPDIPQQIPQFPWWYPNEYKPIHPIYPVWCKI